MIQTDTLPNCAARLPGASVLCPVCGHPILEDDRTRKARLRRRQSGVCRLVHCFPPLSDHSRPAGMDARSGRRSIRRIEWDRRSGDSMPSMNTGAGFRPGSGKYSGRSAIAS